MRPSKKRKAAIILGVGQLSKLIRGYSRSFTVPELSPQNSLMYPEKGSFTIGVALLGIGKLLSFSLTESMVELMTVSTAVDKSNDRVRKMFGEIAPKYDRMNHLLSLNVDRYWRWKTVRKLAPNLVDPILDVCTGTGDLAFAFHNYTQGKVKIIGTDFCAPMLDIARVKGKQNARSVEFVEADAQSLPFEDNRFQIVSAAFGLRNVADTDQGLRELTRVCKPGGKVAILEFSVPRYQPLKAMYGWYFKNVLPRIGQMLARNNSSAYNYLPESVGEFPCYEALTSRMLAAGCSQADFFPLTGGIATLYVGIKAKF